MRDGEVLQVLGLALLLPLLIFFTSLACSAAGAVAGWIVGLAFDDTIAAALDAFGIGPLAPWQLGCFLGFCGGFFRVSIADRKS